MVFSKRLTVGHFSFAASQLKTLDPAPLKTFWSGRLAQSWNLADQPVTHEDFILMTLCRRPGHLASPEGLAEIRKMGEKTMTSLSAGWAIEEPHPAYLLPHMAKDPALVEASGAAISKALSYLESRIHCLVPGQKQPIPTGIGAFAVLIFYDKVIAFLFDVTALAETDARSYPIDEASTMGQDTMGVAAVP